ncbi:hypothetical protein GCM10027160_04870 [Streptomyces calidiresistens]|uniref:DoxX family protein n=1 Tax=Streptomyces calidiresistens TaxID=1485586 RepID=A0A7W3T5H5_9ACTN|nr:hypothetical protein [Streptomyces calidiresistens]MBB0231315.1 hypothetical protein [Streptomyces calidiresistens]
MRYMRHAKGALTVTAATAACHALMSAGYARARDASTGAGDVLFSGAPEFLLTTAASRLLMPILLWAGMRLTGERDTTVFVLVGGLMWAGLSGYFIDAVDRSGGHMPLPALAVFVLLVTALAGIGRTPG